MRLLVCGGRDYVNRDELFMVLDRWHAQFVIDVLTHGYNPKGADALTNAWGVVRNIRQIRFPAEWEKYGKSAGPIRNGEMLTIGKPDCVLAFPGGKGTADMIRQAQKADVPVKQVWPGGIIH